MSKLEKVKNFIEEIRKDDYNIINEWDNNRFKIICEECKSKDVIFAFKAERGAMGSEYTGYMNGFYNNNIVLIKCKCCGHAMTIDCGLADY